MPSEPFRSIVWSSRDVSVAIPTYRRGRALLDTVHLLSSLDCQPGEILVVDQTEQHPAEVEQELRRLESEGRIRIIRAISPSIPQAMNVALREARGAVVLFLDDDVEFAPDLVAAHAARHGGDHAAVCGQVLQPGESPEPHSNDGPRGDGWLADLRFRFCGSQETDLQNVMAGNLSVARAAALAIGGFDEQFIGSAYRFETDFARRLVAAGHRILFAPEASIRHLRLTTGGTRSLGDHLSRPSPLHSVGDYYFAMRHGRRAERTVYLVRRIFRETANRYYLRHPWLLPCKLGRELQAWALAQRLNRQGPRLILPEQRHVIER
jgi:GT2 family glycosyltransferase